MKNLSLIAVLTAFFACGIAPGAHARNTEKVAQQGAVSVEVSSEGESWQDFNVLLTSHVPNIKAEEEGLPEQCTVTAEKDCKFDTIVVQVTADSCSSAAVVAGAIADAVPCPEDIPQLT